MGLLDGKVALITGAARGQGRAHAVTCAREGADVLVLDLADQVETVPYPMATAEDIDETVAAVEALDRRAIPIKADVRSQDAVDGAVAEAISEFGKLDILIANHGIWGSTPFWELSDAQWSDMLDICLTGAWRCAKAVAPHMIERKSGSIVITSSVNGIEPGPGYAHYTAAKHGVIGLTKAVALELAPHGVRCNSVAPGMIDTPMVDNQYMMDYMAGGSGGTHQNLLEAGGHYHVLKGDGQLLPAQVIADAVLWLNSDLASRVTGVTIPVEAGHLLLVGFNHEPAL